MVNNIVSIMPEVLMSIFGLFLIVIDILAGKRKKAGVGYFGIFFIIIALLASVPMGGFKIYGFGGTIVWDMFAFAFFVYLQLHILCRHWDLWTT